MSDPAPQSPQDDLAKRRSAVALEWTKPENWSADGNSWLGKTTPPWGNNVRCSAVRAGRHCRKSAIPGGTVCPTHGGSAPQVKRKAKLQLMSLISPAIATLAREMTTADKSSDRQRAANSLLDRAGMGRAIGDMDTTVARAMLIERYHNAVARKQNADVGQLGELAPEEIEDAVIVDEDEAPAPQMGAEPDPESLPDPADYETVSMTTVISDDELINVSAEQPALFDFEVDGDAR
jgi:hypothetical protein